MKNNDKFIRYLKTKLKALYSNFHGILKSIKRKIIALIILFFVFVGQSFTQTADVVEGCFPLTVQFTSPGAFPTFFWDFKDGASSTQQNPSNTFISAGSFVVEFSEAIGGPVIGTVTIDVYDKPIPEFTATPLRGCVPLNVNVINSTVLGPGISITDYSWVFGDGGTSVGANTNHTFITEGDFFISLELTTNLPSCDVTKSYPNIIAATNQPNTFFTTTPNPPSSCDSFLIVGFNNISTASGTPLTFSWDFGNTNTSILTNPPAESYTAFGNYPVVLTATDTNGCSRDYTRNVSLGTPTADFLVHDTLCINVYDTLINTSSGGNYIWDFGPNAFLDPNVNNGTSFQGYIGGLHPFVRFTTSGMHTVSLIVNSGACADTVAYSFYVQDPSAEFTSSPTYSCTSPMVATFTPLTTNAEFYNWTFGNGEVSTLQNPTTTLIELDTTIYSINGPNTLNNYFYNYLTITTYAGCVANYSLIDTIYQPNARFFPDVVEGCVPLTVNFEDASTSGPTEPLTNWEWVFGDGNTVSATNDNTQTNTYTTVGEYNAYLIVTNSSGCTDTSYHVIIEVGELITPNFSVDITSVCPGDPVQFTDLTAAPMVDSVDAWHYYTEESAMFSCFQEPNPTWVYTNETGPQDVTLTVAFNGCYSSVTIPGMVDVIGPIAEIDYVCNCNQPFTVSFIDSSHSATNISWDFGDGNSSTVSDTVYTYAATGDYTVVLTAFNTATGCATSYDTSIVYIRDLQASFGSDSLICQDGPYTFDASASQDVNEYCHRGYTWYFSDPLTRPITTDNPNEDILFPVTGENEVTLEVTDINGCKDSVSSLVRVFSVNSEFTSDQDTLCLISGLVSFTDSTISDTTVTGWFWEFGDNLTATSQDTTHSFAATTFNMNPLDDDTIRVFLTATNIVGCESKDSMYIFVYRPVSTSSVSDPTICSGTDVTFNASDYTVHGSNLNFNWDFDDNNTSTSQNPTNSFDTAGTYIVQLIYEENSSGCKDSSQIVISVVDYPTAGFNSTADSVLFICPGDQVSFTDTSISSTNINYAWDFGNTFTSTFANPGTFYTNNGDYDVELITTVPAPYQCSDTAVQTYTVKGPSGDFITDLTGPICRLDSVLFTIDDTVAVDTFYWDFGDGIAGSPGISPVSHQYTFVPPGGSFPAKLIMMNSDSSCLVPVQKNVDIYQVVADFTRNFNDIDTTLCLGTPYPLTNNSAGADSWHWEFGDSQSSFIQFPNTHDYATIGTYQVTLAVESINLGCNDTITKTVIIDSIPNVATINDTICEGASVNLDVTNPFNLYQYSWVPANLVVDPTAPNTSSQVLNTTTAFTITATDTFSSALCSSSAISTIYVINQLVLEDFDTLVVIGDTVYLPLDINTDLYNISWSPEDGLSCLNCSFPFVQPLEDLAYHLEISDKEGCFNSVADYTIRVHPETFVKLPTTFTPNGDGVNDIIYLKGWGIKELLEFKIFNRWGEVVFETDDINVGWNGFYKGVLQNNDIYVYKVMVVNWKEEEQTLEGHINLMR